MRRNLLALDAAGISRTRFGEREDSVKSIVTERRSENLKLHGCAIGQSKAGRRIVTRPFALWCGGAEAPAQEHLSQGEVLLIRCSFLNILRNFFEPSVVTLRARLHFLPHAPHEGPPRHTCPGHQQGHFNGISFCTGAAARALVFRLGACAVRDTGICARSNRWDGGDRDPRRQSFAPDRG